MKFGPKQQERIEGWIEDTLRNYNYKPTKLTVVGAGVRYEAEAEFTQKNNKNYEKFHKYFMLTLKEIAVTKGKITSTAEIAKLWRESEYYEQAKTGTVISFSNFEHKAEALLSRKPHEDVVNFLRNIRGKVTINFDSFYEAILDDLTKYYSSSMYAYRENEFIKNSKATTSLIVLVFDMNDDYWNEINYPPDFTMEQFLNNYSEDLTYSANQNFPKDELHSIIYEVNDMLGYLDNLNDTDIQIKVDEITDFSFGIFNQFTVTLSLSDKISNNQMKQLYELLKGSFNITVNLDYDIEDLYGYTNFNAQISYELTSIY